MAIGGIRPFRTPARVPDGLYVMDGKSTVAKMLVSLPTLPDTVDNPSALPKGNVIGIPGNPGTCFDETDEAVEVLLAAVLDEVLDVVVVVVVVLDVVVLLDCVAKTTGAIRVVVGHPLLCKKTLLVGAMGIHP
jgi:hypothetical protein